MARLRISPAQAWRDFLYVGTALPLGIAWLLILGLGLALGIGLLIVTIGIPILAITLLVWKAGAKRPPVKSCSADNERSARSSGRYSKNRP